MHPVLNGELETEAGVLDVAVQCNRAYLSAPWSGLYIVDISDPAQPVKLGMYKSNSYPFGVRAAGGYIYTINYVTGGLFTLRPAMQARWYPGDNNRLAYQDAACWTTTLSSEKNALVEDVKVSIAAPATHLPQVNGMQNVVYSFEIKTQTETGTSTAGFSAPVSVSVQYPPGEPSSPPKAEELAAYQRIEPLEATALACPNPSPVHYDPQTRAFTFQICQPGSYAILGAGYTVNLPIISN